MVAGGTVFYARNIPGCRSMFAMSLNVAEYVVLLSNAGHTVCMDVMCCTGSWERPWSSLCRCMYMATLEFALIMQYVQRTMLPLQELCVP